MNLETWILMLIAFFLGYAFCFILWRIDIRNKKKVVENG